MSAFLSFFDVFAAFFGSFVLGVLTPLTAVCVLPLYPGFLSYLAQQLKREVKVRTLTLGVLVVFGVMSFMLLFGFVFTGLLQISLTRVIGIVSPIAFTLLGIIGVLMLFSINIGRFFPKISAPHAANPRISAFLFGFFFGPVVLPCNPLFIAALFTRTLSGHFAMNLLHFVFFGLGIGFPLLILSVLSSAASTRIIEFFLQYTKWINRVSGAIMVVVAVYYLFFVFRVFG